MKTKIIVEVSGGVVFAVHCSQDAEVEILDHDDADCEERSEESQLRFNSLRAAIDSTDYLPVYGG